MADVQGHKTINLRPGDSVTYEWNAPACSSRGGNDGAIPFGTTLSSVVVKAYKGSVDVTSEIVVQAAADGNIVQAELKYPATNGGGKYELRFALTLDNSEVINKRFNELYAKEDAD